MQCTRLLFVLRSSLCLAVIAAVGSAQSPYATQVVNYLPGPGGGIFNPTLILGGPQGGGLGSGSVDVTSLGSGGQITLGFEVVIADGPGADLSVFENGFVAGGGCFSEVAFVEVSTNGVDFARFPTRYAGPAGPLPAFGTVHLGAFRGLTGGAPVLANVLTGSLSPFNPVESGGEAFDLADLAQDPLVLAGTVDLGAIHNVRLLDVVAGIGLDSTGAPIWDNGGSNSSADLDAVAVIHSAGALTGHEPIVDLSVEPDGRIRLRLGDPDGLFDLNFGTLRCSINENELPITVLPPLFTLVSMSPTEVVLLSAPVAGSGVQALLAISGQDLSGSTSADQVAVQG